MHTSKILYILILAFCTIIQAENKNAWFWRKRPGIKNAFIVGPLRDGPIAIFVHGTKESLISRLVHRVNYPSGIVEASLQGKHSILGRIPYILHEACPQEYNIDSFYIYGWQGRLCFKARRKAALELYKILKNHNGPITLLAHSHGCNVALNLAEIAKMKNDQTFSIDKLILLACPVQAVTASFIKSPIFKRIYSFYSTGDLLQVADPQMIYFESRLLPRIAAHAFPFFSERTFASSPNLTQIRVLLNMKSPGHLNFMLRRFLIKVPEIISLVDQAKQELGKDKFIVNIPRFNAPVYLLEENQICYTPRTVRN